MKGIMFHARYNTVEIRENSDGQAVSILIDDLPELIELCKKAIEDKKAREERESKVSDVTIEVTPFWVSFKQDYDEDLVCISKDELPKLIKLLQKIQEEG